MPAVKNNQRKISFIHKSAINLKNLKKNSSNKKLKKSDKLGKDSKKNFIGKFCGPSFNNTYQQHLVKSIHHGEIWTSGNRETKNN